MFADRIFDLPCALEVMLDHERIARLDGHGRAAIGGDHDTALNQNDIFVSRVGGMIAAGAAFPNSGHHRAVFGRMQNPGFHLGIALGLDPAAEGSEPLVGGSLTMLCMSSAGLFGVEPARLPRR